MIRWLAVVLVGVLAAAAGVVVGYTLWGKRAIQLEHVEQRLQSTNAELTNLREQKDDMAERLQQVSREQERLAQENEILKKQDTTQRLLNGRGGELPSIPPK